MQPRSRSVAPAAAASVLENGISTATCTHASMRFVRERRHPHMPQQKARQHAPRARWRLRGRARAAPAAPRGPTAKLTSGRPRRAGGAHLAPRGRAAPGAGALCPPSGSRRGRASRRPLGCRWRRRRAPAGRRCKANVITTSCNFPSRNARTELHERKLTLNKLNLFQGEGGM